MKRYIPIAAVLACLSVAGAPAFATDEPPPPTPPAAPTAPLNPTDTATAPAAPAPGCVDVTRPTTHLATSSRSASKKHVLRGVAGDKGCVSSSVTRIQVSMSIRHGKKCEYLKRGSRLSRKSACGKPHWLTAAGTASWSLRIPKRLPHGSYQVLTRAVDSAGNVERAHARRLAIK